MPRDKGKASSSTARGKRKATDIEPSSYGGFEKLKGKALSLFKKLDVENHKVLSTKFFNPKEMNILGLHNELRIMMDRAGLNDLYYKKASTYKSLTLEFLSTLEKHKPDNETDEPYITFSLAGVMRTRTYEELRADLGIHTYPEEFEYLSDDACSLFWSAITGARHKEKNDKNTYIPNPYLRLIHRFLNMTFVGLGEPTKVNMDSLRYLWAFTPSCNGIPDWVDIFVNTCLKTQTKGKGGKIPMGGMISLIAMGLGVDLTKYTPVSGGNEYTIKHLSELSMLEDQGFHDMTRRVVWCFGTKNERYLRLPRPSNNPLPNGSNNNDFFVLPDQEFAHNFRQFPFVNEEGDGIERDQDDDNDDEDDEERNDVEMDEETFSNWEIPIRQNQGQPWRNELPHDMSNTQYQQFLQFQQFQNYQQQPQQQQHSFPHFGGFSHQGYADQWLPDCTPNYHVPPTQDGWWPDFMDSFTTMAGQSHLNYQVCMGIDRANKANQVPNYKGPKDQDIEAFDMAEIQKEIRRMERLEKRRRDRDQGGPSGYH